MKLRVCKAESSAAPEVSGHGQPEQSRIGERVYLLTGKAARRVDLSGTGLDDISDDAGEGVFVRLLSWSQ